MIELEKRIKNIRKVTTSLFVIPIALLLLQFLDSNIFHLFPGGAGFWALFAISLFPISVIILVLHYFLARMRKKLQQKENALDDIKVFAGVLGVIFGLFIWAFMYVILG